MGRSNRISKRKSREDEISQFAQCIAGKRQTLPNSDAVFMLEMNKTNKKKM